MKARSPWDVRWWPALPFVAYALVSAWRRDLRVEHFLFIAAVTALAYAGPRARELLRGLYPLALVGLLYDAMRPLKNLGLSEARVHVCDVRAVEARLFGLTSGGARLTLHDWFQEHHALPVDVLAAIPYATFIFVCVATAVRCHSRRVGAAAGARMNGGATRRRERNVDHTPDERTETIASHWSSVAKARRFAAISRSAPRYAAARSFTRARGTEAESSVASRRTTSKRPATVAAYSAAANVHATELDSFAPRMPHAAVPTGGFEPP